MTDWQVGLQAFREGRMREAADRLAAAARQRDTKVSQSVRFETLAFLGAALYALGQQMEAVSAFEDALRLAPAQAPQVDLMVNLANAYLAVGRLDDAREMLARVLGGAPGHMEARMLLQRLQARPAGAPVTGAALGETPDGVKNYLRTLSFSRAAAGGYDVAQVRQALSQIERYIDFLTRQIAARDETIARHATEIERYRQMEERMIENMLQAQQQAQPSFPANQFIEPSADSGPSSPSLDRLLKNKP